MTSASWVLFCSLDRNRTFTLLYKLENKDLVLELVVGGVLFCESCGDGGGNTTLFPKKEPGMGLGRQLSSSPLPSQSLLEAEGGIPRLSKCCVVGKSTREQGSLFWSQGLVILDPDYRFLFPLQPLCPITRRSSEGWWTLGALITSVALSGRCEKGKRGVVSSQDSFQLTHPPTLITEPHRHELSLFWGQLRVSRSPKLRWWFEFYPAGPP